MREDRETARRSWRIGVWEIWALLRGVELFFIVALLKGALSSFRVGEFSESASAAVLIAVMVAYWHRFAAGSIDATGIHFRRYYRMQTVPWSKLREVRWQGSGIVFVFRSGGWLSRRLDFYLNPLTTLGRFMRERLGGDADLPPILERIKALAGDTVPIVSAVSGSKWRLRFFGAISTLLILMLVILLIRAISAQ
jgi:hypothetical protein